MSVELIIPGAEPVRPIDHLPATYTGPVLQGAAVQSFQKENTAFHLQELLFPDFHIRVISGRSDSIEAKSRMSNEGLYGSFMLKNNIRRKTNKTSSVLLCKDHHILSYGFKADCKGTIEQPYVFEMLDIFYSPDMLKELVEYFPGLSAIIRSRSNQVIGNRTFWTPPLLREIYRQILDCPFDVSCQRLFFELKVREMLLHILKTGLNPGNEDVPFTSYEIARIYEAKDILETYIDKKPPTIKELSRMVAINEFKLKLGFRKFFNTGIFGLLTTQKMHRARLLVEETNKPLKEIAAISGYPRITNFITAFRKHFGITPGTIRRS